MLNKPTKTLAFIGILTVSTIGSILSCQNTSSLSPAQSLSGLTTTVILPTYLSLAEASEDLSGLLTALCAAPTAESLTAAQDQWKRARSYLKKVEVVSFGPYKESDYDAFIDFWPVRTDNIDDAIEENGAFSQDTVDSLGASVRGLPAMEYLLFGTAGNDAVLESLTTGDFAVNRCALLVALGTDLSANTRALHAAWSAEGDDFGSTLANAGSNDTYPTMQSAVTELVNQMAFLIELVKDTKIGKPLGLRSGGDPQPEEVESLFSEHSVQDMIDNLEGLKSFYTGTYGDATGSSLYHLVADKDTFMAGLVIDYIDTAIAAIGEIPEPLAETVVNDPSPVEVAYEKLGLLKALVSGPVSGLLGVAPYFNDNDGD